MEMSPSKQKILEEALRLFSTNGYEATSIRQITDTVGIRKASLYSHFQSKREILDTLIADLTKFYEEKLLFGKTDEYTENQIAINITSNLFGMGNACTPSGMNAIKGLDKNCGKYATSAMIMVIILNSTSLQLIPTTIIGLRITAGSATPTDIIIPTLIATLVSTLSGILLVKIFSKIFKDKHE